jgi:hypothetical protein
VLRLSRLDWIVVADIAVCALMPTANLLFGADNPRFVMWAVPLAIVTWPILLLWMFRGGATSPLWTWLPPFWPWGRMITARFGRWCLVLVLIAGSVLGAASLVARW